MPDNTSIQSVLSEYDLIDLVSGLAPQKRVEYAPRYFTDSNTGANQCLFFLTGHYDPQIVSFAERNKQPITPGELLTLGSAPTINAFQGPVLVLTGCEHPTFTTFIDGNCQFYRQQMTFPSAVVTTLRLATRPYLLFRQL